jgi:hypothetical protein
LHDSIERRMAAKQIGGAPFDNPGKVGAWQSIAQGTQHRQSVNAIANGREANNEDARAMNGHAMSRCQAGPCA